MINIAADHQMFMTLTGELSWQRLRRSAVEIYSKKRKNRSLRHPLGDLGVTYALYLWLVVELVVDFILVVIELFRYLLRLRRCERKSVEVGVLRKGVGHFERRFQREGGIAHQPLLVSEN